MRTIPASLATGLAAAALAAVSTTAVLASSTPPATGVPAATAAAVDDGTTRVVLRMPDCEGCTVQVVSGLATDDPDEPRLWASLEKEVRDGKVAFPVPHSRTSGMTIQLDAPWEGHLGYRTTVALRYAGEQPGEEMTAEAATGKRRASACFEGTSVDKLVLPVHVEEVTVDGVQGEVPGTLAFLTEALPWLTPMEKVVDGVLGSQDVRVCR